MKGDFSRWKYNRKDNFSGVLHQQGRVSFDPDWNDGARIANHWQDQAGQDVIGPGVAAVPASESDSFQVQAASVVANPDRVELTVAPGRLWADGILAYLSGEQPDPTADVRRIATYLQPPIQDPSHDESGIGEGTRDAIILEVWREALNGFQMPTALIEPALGGPDTTERILTAMRFRLLRLQPEDTCGNIGDRLKDDFSQKGKLTVSLLPTTIIDGDCPVAEGGGYVGFEHLLYRIEMAEVNVSPPGAMFKWSQFNGGLVGRGECDLSGPDKKITLTANDQAIKMSGLTNFYLEVIEEGLDQGYWRLTYGAEVTINGDDLEVTTEHYSEGSLPSGRVFFRLWNGIVTIADFPKVAAPTKPNELLDGIRLEFDAGSGANYQPGDYWTFQVRAGEIPNLDPLIDDQPPEGIHYHRVPLAILNWDENRNVSFTDGEIDDCRDIIRPLTNQNVCCSFTVGDGRSSKGDFNSIEEAVRHLPASGGEICLLPGLHEANVIIKEKRNIKIKGCDKKTKIIPGKANRKSPIFHVIDSHCITLEHMDMVTLGGSTILLEGTKLGNLKEVEVHHNRILACENAVTVKRGVETNIHHNKFWMLDMLDKEGGVAILIMAEDSLIERNIIGVVPAERIPPVTPPGGEVPPDPTDPCTDPERVYGDILFFILYVDNVWGLRITSFLKTPFKALGGIQIVGGSERLMVFKNKIIGGAGNGITLGGFLPPAQVDSGGDGSTEHVIEHRGESIFGEVIPPKRLTLNFENIDGVTSAAVSTVSDKNTGKFVTAADPGSYRVSILTLGFKIGDISTTDSGDDVAPISHRIGVVEEEIDLPDLLAFIYEIQIDGNEISNMGLSGIGIPRIKVSEPPSGIRPAGLHRLRLMAPILARFGNPVVGLSIYRNHIFNCLQNPFDDEMRAEVKQKGIGGISLGICEDLSIRENRIEDNGTSHITPVCGIYVADGEYVNISHNHLANNGPLTAKIDAELAQGIRGGVVLTVSAFSKLDPITGQGPSAFNGKPAARFHDNVVDQPAGPALRIVEGLGPVSVVNNWFNSELSGREKLDLLAGAVLIYNLGGLHKTGATLGRNETGFARNAQVVPLPNGNTLFNSNQTRVGPANDSSVSQFIYSPDDIGFDGNQSENLKKDLSSNTILLGGTLRASDNRFEEIKQGGFVLSLLTLTRLLNNTSNNQGNHCIIAINKDPGRPEISTPNQVLIAPSDQCGRLIKLFKENPQFLGAII